MLQRIFEPPHVEHERLLPVSIVGFIVNIIGIFAFAGHHGHSHGGGDSTYYLLNTIQLHLLLFINCLAFAHAVVCSYDVTHIAVSGNLKKIALFEALIS